MPHTPHQRLASAGFSPDDTARMIKIFDVVSPRYSSAAIDNIIIDALCTMLGAGSRSPTKIAAYADHRARAAAIARYGAPGASGARPRGKNGLQPPAPSA